MSIHQSYHVPVEIDPPSVEPTNLTRRLPAEFRDWPLADLDEMEFRYLKDLADAREAGQASDVEFVENQLAKLDAERDRQERIVRAEAEHRGRRAPGIRHDGPQLAGLAVQLKERVSLIEFVEASGATTIGERSGNRVMVHCPNPMHPDHHPSCIVDARRFHCFRCAADGDIYDLVNLVWGVGSFRDRVRIIAEYARQAVRP